MGKSTAVNSSSPPSAAALATRFLPGVSARFPSMVGCGLRAESWNNPFLCKLPLILVLVTAVETPTMICADINQNMAPILTGSNESRPSTSLHVHVNENCSGTGQYMKEKHVWAEDMAQW